MRYRCSACGNQTRFDVVTTRRTRAFHHFTIGGELQVEDEAVLHESVDDVTCRWCGTGAGVATIGHEIVEIDGALVVAGEAGGPTAADAAGET
jgi:hypothetical protein